MPEHHILKLGSEPIYIHTHMHTHTQMHIHFHLNILYCKVQISHETIQRLKKTFF